MPSPSAFGWGEGGNSSLASGILQLQNGVALDTTLRNVADQNNTISPLKLSTTLVGIASAVQYDWVSTPAGAASKTTMWFDASGRMNWRPGTGASSYIRTFDATGITADRVYSLPDSTMTIIGLNGAIDTTLRAIIAGGTSPLKVSTTQVAVGSAFTAGYYANATMVVSNYTSSGDEGANIGIFAASQATLNSATRYGYAIYGHGYTNGSARSGGVVGEGKVTASADTGSAIGIRGYSNDTHAGGMNIGLYGEASGGLTNYALYMNAGDIWSTAAQTWQLPSVARSSGTNTDTELTLAYTINNTGGTNTVTGFKLNATETSVTGTTHNLFDWQVASVSRLRLTKSSSDTYLYFSTTDRANGMYIYYGNSGHVGEINYSNIFRISKSSTYYPFYMDATGQVGMNNLNTLAATLSVSGYGTNDIQRWYKSDTTTLVAAINKDGVLSINNTVASAVGVASTHKVTMVIGGTTYYLLASNV